MAKVNHGSNIRLLHLLAGIFLLTHAVIQFESGATSWFFIFSGSLALLISIATASFLTRPSAEALILWLEAICFMLAALKSFNSGKSIIPWLFILAALIYAVQGYKSSGLK